MYVMYILYSEFWMHYTTRMNKDGTRNEFWIVSDNQWSILGDPFEEIRLVEDGFVRNISDYGKL